jgi:hypothetical protein
LFVLDVTQEKWACESPEDLCSQQT